MKISAKPISSPSRTDKFPTPLMMRFLRSNVGSRSRGSRSRSSSPMFIMRTKKNVAAINNDVQQEPSSPKVTCIGQVRARRASSKSKAKNSKSKRPNPNSKDPPPKRVLLLPHHHCCCCCSCGVRTHFCCNFRKPKLFCSYFRKWVMFFRFGYCKKVDTRDDCSSRVESITRRVQNDVNLGTRNVCDVEDKEGKNVGETKEDFLESPSFSSSPPKNALLLTRCRSAPYRSSSLAGRFWGSPITMPEAESEKSPKKEVQKPQEGEMERPAVESESRNSSSHEGSATEEFESSSNGGDAGGSGGGGGAVHPLLLTRCKSEPARTGERLNPEVNFWRQRRSDTTESCLQESSNLSCD